SRRECDETPGAAILIDALQDAGTLSREAFSRERFVSLFRDRLVDVVERSDKVRSPRLAVDTRLQMRAVGRGDLEVETDLDEPIVGQMRMAHTADLVAVISAAAWV